MMIVQYIKRSKRIVGALVAIKVNETVQIGWSLCNKEDTAKQTAHELKQNAVEIALGRARKLHLRADSKIPDSVARAIIHRKHIRKMKGEKDVVKRNFVERCAAYFKLNAVEVAAPIGCFEKQNAGLHPVVPVAVK